MSRDALVVGINTYDRLNSLRSPSEDAEAIAKILANYGDFTVHRLPAIADTTHNTLQVGRKTPVTLEALRQALAQLFKPKSRQYPDTALFYFSGHGLRDDVGIQQGYLATSDVNPDRGIYGLPLWWLRQLLEESPVQQQAIWLDCCHSGELLNFAQANPEERGRGRDRSFIAACRDFGEAFEAPGDRYSILTQALLAGLDPASQPERRVTNLHLVASLSPHFQREPQQPVFINSGGPILLTRSGQVSAPPAIVEDGALCPYKGLAYFDYNNDDPNYFHGRRALTDELLGKLRQGNFLAILGASGSGKSSVLRAGLLHQLQRGQQLSGSDQWPIYLFNPGEHPLQSLAEVFLETDDLSTIERADQLRKAQDFVNAGAVGLGKLIDAALRKTAAKRVVLAIDQFEECFTLCGDSAERQQFFECVLGTLDRPGDQLRLVLVMRVDFLKKCLEQDYAGLAKKIQNNLVAVTSMNRQELEQAITAPAKQVGLEIETGLVEQMRVDVGSALGSLPLLQFALTELWKRRTATHLTFAAYHKLGSLRGALEQQAEEAYTSLSQEEQDVAKRIFLALIQPGQGTEDTSRQAFQQELVALHCSEAVVIRVIQKLATARLIVTSVLKPKSPGDQKNVVDIAHEALIRHWSRLRQWIQDNRDALRQKQQIEAAAEEWQAQGQTTQVEFLLQGSKLAVALEFSRDYADQIPLSQLAQELVQVSEEERDRITQAEAQRQRRELQQERRLRIASFSFAGFAMAAAIGLGFLGHNLIQQKISLLVGLSESEFSRNQQLEALIASIKAGKQLRRTPLVPTEIRIKTLIALNKAIYDTRESNRLEGHTAKVHSVSFSPEHCDPPLSQDKIVLASASNDGTIRLWQPDGTLLQDLPLPHHSASLSLSCDGKKLVSGTHFGEIQLWTRKKTTDQFTDPPKTFNIQGKPRVWQLSFSPDSQSFASASDDNIARLWTLDDQQKPQPLKGHGSYVNDVRFSPNGKILASASTDGTIRLWDTETHKELITLPHGSAVNQVSFISDEHLASASTDGKIKLWQWELDPINKQPIEPKAIDEQENNNATEILNLRFSPGKCLLASVSSDTAVILWKLKWDLDPIDEKLIDPKVSPKEKKQAILNLMLSPRKCLLASGSNDKTVRLWKPEQDRLDLRLENVNRFTIPEDTARSVGFSPNGKTIAFVRNETVRLWTPESKKRRTLPDWSNCSEIYSIAFNPGSKKTQSEKLQLAIACDNTIKLWTAKPSTIEQDIISDPFKSAPPGREHTATIRSLDFSPDGKFVISASDDGTVKQWQQNGTFLEDIATQAQQNLPSHQRGFTSTHFSQDGQSIIMARKDGTLQLWQSDKPPISFTGHQEEVTSARFSSTGKWIVSTSYDKTVKLWQRNGKGIADLNGHQDEVTHASFRPDGKTIASVDLQGAVHFWNRKGDPIETLKLRNVDDMSFSPDGKHLALFNGDTLILVELELDSLLEKACERLQPYLNNPSATQLNPDNRSICNS